MRPKIKEPNQIVGRLLSDLIRWALHLFDQPAHSNGIPTKNNGHSSAEAGQYSQNIGPFHSPHATDIQRGHKILRLNDTRTLLRSGETAQEKTGQAVTEPERRRRSVVVEIVVKPPAPGRVVVPRII